MTTDMHPAVKSQTATTTAHDRKSQTRKSSFQHYEKRIQALKQLAQHIGSSHDTIDKVQVIIKFDGPLTAISLR